MIAQEELIKRIEYNPETGLWRWRPGYKWRHRNRDWFSGTSSGKGYFLIYILGEEHGAHRLAWLYTYGYMPEKIDHKDKNPSNNRIENLREANQSENAINRVPNSNNTTGTTGVVYRPDRNKPWIARICYHYVEMSKGFRTKEEAIAWRKQKIYNLFGEFAP